MRDARLSDDLFGDAAPPLRHGTHELRLRVSASFGRRVCVSISATIAGEPELGVDDALVDRAGLLASATRTGEHIVFNCSCGFPGCGAFDSVKVEVGENTVTWRWLDGPALARMMGHLQAGDRLAAAAVERQVAVFDRREIERTVRMATAARDIVMKGLERAGIAAAPVPYEPGAGRDDHGQDA